MALTETARLADYVLPASSQYEKWEATFFTLEFPKNVFHLRAPLLEPLPGTLPEPEIHRRLAHALGALDEAELAPLRAAAAQGRAAYAAAFFGAAAKNPKLGALAPVVLYETLGPALPDGAAAAAPLLGLAIQCAQAYPESLRRAGYDGANPLEQGEALFDAILRERSGIVFSVDEPSATWTRLETEDGRIHLAVPELLAELARARARDRRPARSRLPLRARGGRAAHQHREHDLPRPELAPEGRGGRAAHEPGGRRAARPRGRRRARASPPSARASRRWSS